MENEEKIVVEIGEQQEEVVINDEPEVKEETDVHNIRRGLNDI